MLKYISPHCCRRHIQMHFLKCRRLWLNKTNLRDLIAATRLVILLKLDWNHQFCSPCDLDILWMTPKNNGAPLLYYIKLCASFQIHQWIQTGVTVRKRTIKVEIDDFFYFKNNRAPLLCYFDLCASFRSHWWIQTGVTVQKRPIWSQLRRFFLPVWPCNLTHDLQKQQVTSSMLLQALCIIS